MVGRETVNDLPIEVLSSEKHGVKEVKIYIIMNNKIPNLLKYIHFTDLTTELFTVDKNRGVKYTFSTDKSDRSGNRRN